MRVGFVQSVRDSIECMRIRPLLQPFLDGALDDEQGKRVARHLEACRRCGLESSTYRTLKQHLRALARPAEPEAVARLEAFIDDLGAEPDEAGPSAP
jgi:anti-sigma factor RsiW